MKFQVYDTLRVSKFVEFKLNLSFQIYSSLYIYLQLSVEWAIVSIVFLQYEN